jgi:hypothetical protein
MDSASLPLPFYLCFPVVAFFAWQAWQARDDAWGIPMIVVLATAGAWYLGDPLYNDYGTYVGTIGADFLTDAWWEVLLFFVALGMLGPAVSARMNHGVGNGRSMFFAVMRSHEMDTPAFQDQVAKMAFALFLAWSVLMTAALIRTDGDVIGLFFPYLGERADPWARDRIGGGVDALYALAGYIQILLTSLFAVTLALSKRVFPMVLSGILYFLSAPYFIFGRTRNAMLSVLLPGLIAFLTLRIRGSTWLKIGIAIASFVAIEGWFKFVLDNRDKGTIAEAFKTGGSKDEELKAKKHLGFNMFEELGYINYFIENGSYKVNWGERYFAEIVNPIPRVLWPGKPMIGIDYAIARGMGYGDQAAKSGGVAASISTGMIGQGVVNFGRILGPIASALLMAFWVAVLARQDLMGSDIGHILLYAIGLVLTFNMGRDITLLVIYPFVFGWIFLILLQRGKPHATASSS